MQKLELLNLEPQMPNLGAAILKNYCHFCNQRNRICLIAKFGAEAKNV